MSNNFKHDIAYYLLVLDLPSNFNENQLKKAYKREAKKWHPDLNKNDVNADERLKLINEAYEFLSKVKNFKSQNQSSTKGYKNQYKQEDKSDFTPWKPKNNKYNPPPPTQGELEFIKWFVIAFFVYIYYKIVVG